MKKKKMLADEQMESQAPVEAVNAVLDKAAAEAVPGWETFCGDRGPGR